MGQCCLFSLPNVSRESTCLHLMSPPTWVCPGSSSRCPEIYVFRSGSSSSSPSRSAAYRCVFLSKVEMKHCFAWHPLYANYIYWGNKPHREPSTCSPTSACSLQSGGWWGFSSSWRHPPLSSWPPPPPYEFSHPMREKVDEETKGGLGWLIQQTYSGPNMIVPPDASAAPSLSRCGSCAALLAQRGASPARQIITRQQILKGRPLTLCATSKLNFDWLCCGALTILSLRLMISSSSFFLLSKWTSIRVWSSIRSFSILLRCISYRNRRSEPVVRVLFVIGFKLKTVKWQHWAKTQGVLV